MYSVYCTNYPNALKFTQTMQKQKPQFHNFCRVRLVNLFNCVYSLFLHGFGHLPFFLFLSSC